MRNPLFLAALALCLARPAAADTHNVNLFWAFGDGKDFKTAYVDGRPLSHPEPQSRAWVASPGEVTAKTGDVLRLHLLNAANTNTVTFTVSVGNQVLAEADVKPVNEDYGAISLLRPFKTDYAHVTALKQSSELVCEGQAGNPKLYTNYICITVPEFPMDGFTRGALRLSLRSLWGGGSAPGGGSRPSELIVRPGL